MEEGLLILLKIEENTLRDGGQDIDRDTDHLLAFKGGIIQKQALFLFSCSTPCAE